MLVYEYLIELGESVLYCDTDFVIYIHKVDEPQKVKSSIIWVSAQMSWRSMAQVPTLKSLFWVVQKSMHSLSFPPRQEIVQRNVM